MDWKWVVYGVIVLVFIWLYARQKAIKSVVNYYYLNTKPSFEKNGFEAEAGWCTETTDFLDSLYYLRRPSECKAFSKVNADILDEWFADDYYERGEDEPEGNRYSIAFMPTARVGSNLGTLTLSADQRGYIGRPGGGATDLMHVYAPIAYFNSTSLPALLQIFKNTIDSVESGREVEFTYLVFGLNGVDKKVYGLSIVHPREKSEKRLAKRVSKLTFKGYANLA